MRSLLVLFFFTTMLGCGAKSGRSAVSGTVSYKGIDVAEGSIQFTPEDLSKGNPEGAVIKNGKYAIPADKGLIPGTYVVQITAPAAPTTGGGKNPGAPKAGNELLPEQFNVKSKLRAEVKAGQANQIDFLLSE